MINANAIEIIGESCNEEGEKNFMFSDPVSSQIYLFERPNSIVLEINYLY